MLYFSNDALFVSFSEVLLRWGCVAYCLEVDVGCGMFEVSLV